MGVVLPLVLAGTAVALIWLAPGLMARRTSFRRAPLAALIAWQAVAVGGVVAALGVPVAVLGFVLGRGVVLTEHPELVLGALVTALAVDVAVVVRLLVRGHVIGTRLREARARHREVVDALGTLHEDGFRVIAHPTPTAYCIPGRHSRVVLSESVLEALAEDELAAVLAHEQAHLSSRHDLLVEFFTVVHESAPARLRSPAALSEVRLLVEALADRSAVARSGAVATARALVAVARGQAPEVVPSATRAAAVRLGLLALEPHRSVAVAAFAFAVLVAVLPVVLVTLALR